MMWRFAGTLLVTAALARADGAAGRETVEETVRAHIAAASVDDIGRDSLVDSCLAAGAPAADAADAAGGEAADGAAHGFAAIPFPGMAPRGPISAAAEATTKPWEITGALGFTLTDGNSETITLAVTADAKREWELWKLFMGLRILYAETDGDQSASEWIFLERLERKLSERATIFQDFLAEHDEEEDLRYRLQLTLGYNRRLAKSEKFELWGNVGGGVLHEDFFNESETEAIAQLGITFTWQITKNLKYEQILTFYPSLSEGGEFRMYWESVFTTPVSDRFDLRLSIIDRYDSNPQPGIEENDLTIALTLAIKFTKPPPAPAQ
jgi:putative salt-induced outer membrane protein YdiY